MPGAVRTIPAMQKLAAIVRHLEQLLDHARIGDYPGAHNGLQFENSGTVSRVACAVDACEAVLREAASVPGTLLLVHHGLLWSGAQTFTGAFRRKVQTAIEGDLAVFSSHLPLDLHPTLGNNALLAKALGLKKTKPAFSAKGQMIGLIGELATTRDALAKKLAAAVNGRIHIAPGGPERIRHIGVVTGGAGREVAAAAALGCDAFITGEGPHDSYTLAEELCVNLFYGGHYATETFGVRALAEHVAKKFRLPSAFIDHPTGL
jgi:dinuclear metal center YbgI/SA1388 family protein